MKHLKKRAIAFVAALYPPSWREEFGEEFEALLDDVKPSRRVFMNVLGGAIEMQMTTGTNWLKLAAATAALGAIVAGAASFRVAPLYISSAVMSVTPQPDPVRPTSPQILQLRTAERVAETEMEVLSRSSLALIIQEFGLYDAERKRMPMEDVIRQMRGNIRIETHSSTIGFSFSYPDQVKAQATVRELTGKFTEINDMGNRFRQETYRDFWQDMSRVDNAKPVPPPPVGETLGVIKPASLPMASVGPNRLVFLTWGLGAGLLVGLLAALAMRWPRSVLQLAGFAAAGCILAGVASFLIPNRYTSTAVMEIAPAAVTEDPMAPIPPVTPAAEYLRQMEPQVLSFQSLSWVIQNPRLDLYPGERTSKPMEEVIRSMLANDLRITALNPQPGAKAAASAFSISFSYPDRFKAQQAVQWLMDTFRELDQKQKRTQSEDASQSIAKRRIPMRGGENIQVLDVASLPMTPGAPNRALIAASGLCAGLLLGAIKLRVRRPRAPALQPA